MAETIVGENGQLMTVVEEGDPNDPLRETVVVTASQGEQDNLEPEAAGAEATRQATAPATATAESEEDLSDEELGEMESKLDDFIASEVNKAVGRVQSIKDRELDAVKRQLQANLEQSEELRKAVRDAQLNGLPEDERQRLQTVWELEDRQSKLDNYASELDGFYHDLKVHSLASDYSQFGVTPEDLESITGDDWEEQMEAVCNSKELEHWRALAAGGQTAKNAQAAADPAKATPAPSPKAAAPAGAQARTDMGGSAPAVRPRGPSQGQGQSALAETFKSLPWESVRTR